MVIEKDISYKESTTDTTSSPTSGYILMCMPVLAADCECPDLGTIIYQNSPFEGQGCAVHETKDGNKIATTYPAYARQRGRLRNFTGRNTGAPEESILWDRAGLLSLASRWPNST